VGKLIRNLKSGKVSYYISPCEGTDEWPVSLMLLKGRQDFLVHIWIGGPSRATTHMGFRHSGFLITHPNFNLRPWSYIHRKVCENHFTLLVHPGVMNATSVSLPSRREVHTFLGGPIVKIDGQNAITIRKHASCNLVSARLHKLFTHYLDFSVVSGSMIFLAPSSTCLCP
jgi:hypothetical protein